MKYCYVGTITLLLICLLSLGGGAVESDVQILRQAIDEGDLATVEELCQQGIDLHQTIDNEYGNLTPLMCAVLTDNPELVKLILRFDSNPNYKVKPGDWSAVSWALYQENLEIVQILLAAGAVNDHCEAVSTYLEYGEITLPDNDFTNDEVQELVLEAYQRYVTVDIADYNEEGIFELDGQVFMYFSSEIDTKEKMLNYLQEIFTPEVSQQILEKRDYREYNGKLYHSYGEMGFPMMWSAAEVKLLGVTEDGLRRHYAFLVPEMEGYYELEDVYLNYIGGKWYVDTIPPY